MAERQTAEIGFFQPILKVTHILIKGKLSEHVSLLQQHRVSDLLYTWELPAVTTDILPGSELSVHC